MKDGWYKIIVFFFFFKQKTAYEMCGRDWSSDVCSSDLHEVISNRPIQEREFTDRDGEGGGEKSF